MPRFIGARCGVNSTVARRVFSLLDLRGVAVVEQPVGGEVLVGAAERELALAGARHAAGGVDDDAVGLDQPGPHQRGQRQGRRRRVAAGRGDQLGAARAASR